MIGQSIAHYKITEKLGEGGMGEVYRATDDRLNRQVAVKVLPDSFAADPSRLARFRREAQVLASLNHPHIAQVYGLEEQDGRQGIILELVEGETLAERIARGPIPFDEARVIGLKVAQALEAAHDKGIVHRDLKPANIKVVPSGDVKVLDFGLAKAQARDNTGTQASHSPTMTMATQEGVLMGTAAYMPPEQARGMEVDHRADVWAFGCVLYEMLTGRRPFAGSDVSEILAHVITQDPDLSLLPTSLPRSVGDMLGRCLRKDVELRLPAIGAARIALLEAGEEENLPAASAPPQRRSLSSLPVLAGLAGVAGLAMGLLVAWLLLSPQVNDSLPEQGATHFELVLDPPPVHWSLALSRAGDTLIYSGGVSGSQQLYKRDLRGFTSEAIPGSEGGFWPVLSPDENSLAFFAAGRLKTVNMQGGVVRTLSSVGGDVNGMVWTADDNLIFATNMMTVPQRMNAGGGEPQPLIVQGMEEGARVQMPKSLPGSNKLLVTLEAPNLDGKYAATLDPQSGVLDVLTRGEDARFMQPDQLLYVQGNRVMAAGFDPVAGALLTPEQPSELSEPAIFPSWTSSHFFSVSSQRGDLIYPSGSFPDEHELFWLSRDGEIQPTGLKGAMPRLDSTEAFALASRDDGNIWMLNLDTASGTQISFSGSTSYAVWSVNEQSILYGDTLKEGAFSIYRIARDGKSDPKKFIDSGSYGGPPSPIPLSFHPSGAFMIYGVDPLTSRDIWIVNAEGDVEPILRTNANERGGSFSPDGKLFAYVSDETGSDQIIIRQYPDTGRRWQVTSDGGASPVWHPSSRELFFRSGDALQVASVSVAGGIRVGEPVTIYRNPGLYNDLWGNQTFDVATDGRILIALSNPIDVKTRMVLSRKTAATGLE